MFLHVHVLSNDKYANEKMMQKLKNKELQKIVIIRNRSVDKFTVRILSSYQIHVRVYVGQILMGSSLLPLPPNSFLKWFYDIVWVNLYICRHLIKDKCLDYSTAILITY